MVKGMKTSEMDALMDEFLNTTEYDGEYGSWKDDPEDLNDDEDDEKPAKKQEHDYGNTQIQISPHSSAALSLNVARDQIRDEDLMATGKDVDPNHVTVRYGLLNDDLDELRSFLASQTPFEASLGQVELFPASDHSDGAVPVVAQIISPELRAIEAEIGKHADFKDKNFPEYKPHCTLAYVKPGAAESYADLFLHGSFVVQGITISHQSGVKETIPFGHSQLIAKWEEGQHPRDEKGKFSETFHGTTVSTIAGIKAHGLLASKNTDLRGRTKSVYVTTDEDRAHYYGLYHGAERQPSGFYEGDYAIVKAEIPIEHWDKNAIEDERDDEGIGSSFRFEQDIPVEWIKSIQTMGNDGRLKKIEHFDGKEWKTTYESKKASDVKVVYIPVRLQSVAKFDEAKHPRDKEGQFTESGVPPEPGTTPIPPGKVRAYHYTDNLDAVEKEGLSVGKARGNTYGEPNVIWFSTEKPGDFKDYVEVFLDPEEIGIGAPQMVVKRPEGWKNAETPEEKQEALDEYNKGNHNLTALIREVPPERFVTVHRPWYDHYRYLVNDARAGAAALAGEYDWALAEDNEYAPAIRLFKAKHAKKKDPISGRYVTPFVSFDKQGDEQLRMIASLNSSRLATWGFTAEAEVRGMARYKLTAVLDGRTSKFCRLIDGKIFEVSDARAKVIEALNVQDPEDLKMVQPWPKQTKEALAAYAAMSPEELTALGLHIPPYHPHCRTILRAIQSSIGEVKETVPTTPVGAEMFQAVTQEDLKELGVEATQEQVDQWNAHIGMTPGELLSKFSGLPPQEVMTKGKGVGANPITFEDGNIGFNVHGADPQGVEFKLGAILDPFTGIYYLSKAELLAGSPKAELSFMKNLFNSLIEMGLKSSATEVAVGVAGNAVYYAQMGFLPDELEWDSLRRFALEGNSKIPEVLASLKPEDRLLVEHLLQDKSVGAMSALVELPFTYENKTIGEWLFGEATGTWALDLTDDLVVAQAKAYLA